MFHPDRHLHRHHLRQHLRRHADGRAAHWHAHRAVHRVAVGSGLVLLGIGYLLRGQGLVSTDDLWLVAPIVIALSGIAGLVAAPGVGSVLRALVRLAVAAYLAMVILHVGGWTLAATWPVLLIAVGAVQVGHALFGRRTRRERNW